MDSSSTVGNCESRNLLHMRCQVVAGAAIHVCLCIECARACIVHFHSCVRVYDGCESQRLCATIATRIHNPHRRTHSVAGPHHNKQLAAEIAQFVFDRRAEQTRNKYIVYDIISAQRSQNISLCVSSK